MYPEYNFVSHDLSKFSSEELEPYTIKFIQKAPDSQNPNWNDALEHHYRNNPHHPQVCPQYYDLHKVLFNWFSLPASLKTTIFL